MNRIELVRKVAHWTVPQGIQKLALGYLSHGRLLSQKSVLERNKVFRDRHTGERCFILATGPSIREQDLTPLREEWCIACSEFYKHEHYELIRPAYYCTAPFHRPHKDEDLLRRLEEMSQKRQGEMFFFALSDRELVARSKLGAGSEHVYYLAFSPFGFSRSQIDLTGRLPGPQSVAIMAAWVAIYMGFSEICLVGCDHDWLWRWDGSQHHTPEHFYDGAPTIGHEPFDIEYHVRAHLSLVVSYRWMNQVALSRNIKIINANPKSYIDTFPKIPLETLLDPRAAQTVRSRACCS